MTEKNTAEAFLARASSRLLWPTAAGSILLMVALLVLLITVKGSVDRFEDQLHYQPPLGAERSAFHSTKYLAKSQSLYVPVYSHVYIHDGAPFHLTATLSIRNTDSANPLFVQSVRYYDSAGKFVRQYIEQPLEIAPHATTEFLVEEKDKTGGSGANFVVEWASENPLTQPVVEAVMIGASGQQGISFVCPAVVVSETRREPHELSGAEDSSSVPTP